MKKHFLFLPTVLLSLSLALLSCSGGGDKNGGNNSGGTQTVSVTGVTLNKTSTSLSVGGSETLTATVQPPNATNKTVNWSSSNSGIASVNATTGLVTGISVGSARITATTNDGSYTAHCDVTVTGITPPPGGSGDVYVAGAEWFYTPSGINTVPTVWKNGVPKEYGKGYYAKVFVSGNDVYVITDNRDDCLVTVYKNDAQYQQIQVKLANLHPERALSIFVSGNDVYVCACVPTGFNYPDFKPMLWKNGVQQNLSYNSQNNAYANSI
ncbi:MAG: Ig-like domain-containing protein [Holophagaceae bacterium]|nr:Ig-like domain-containing protein [Holophagaceae bacterium]